MDDLEHTDHSGMNGAEQIDLVWQGDYWDVMRGTTRLGSLAESYPAVGRTNTIYVAKHSGQENNVDGVTDADPWQAVAGLLAGC